MNFKAITRVAVMAAGLALAASVAGAAEPANPHVPLAKTIGKPTTAEPIASLGVLNADGATLADGKLTLTGVAGNVIVFADRPARAAGHETTDTFVARWSDGNDSFSKDPPNATISILGGEKEGVTDAVVTISNPKLDGDKLTFDAKVLEGDLKGVKGPAALFIDYWYVGPGGYLVHGHRAWYGYPPPVVYGAPYVPPPPACGYYPYPPCY